MILHAVYKLRENLEDKKLYVHMGGSGNNDLYSRIDAYDMMVSNAQLTVETYKPIFNAIPLITRIGK